MISPISSVGTLSALHQLNRNQNFLFETMKRLATGRRINSGKDDPAGLISSERLAAEIRALEAESRSYQRINSNADITEGHASQLSAMYQDLHTLVLAGANQAGMSDAEIAANQMQIDNIVAGIGRFTENATASLDGLNLPNGGNAEVEALYNSAYAAAAAVRSGGADDLSSGNFDAALIALEGAIGDIATSRGMVGTYQKDVLEPQLRSNQIAIENLSESHSRIVDTDYALETSLLAQAQILVKASVLTLKIANQQAATVLDLLS